MNAEQRIQMRIGQLELNIAILEAQLEEANKKIAELKAVEKEHE